MLSKRAELYNRLIESGKATLNEIRQAEGMAPIDGGNVSLVSTKPLERS